MTGGDDLERPLAGVRVLELDADLTTSYATKLFADYGAEVIKVERLGTGDRARSLPPLISRNGTPVSTTFLHLNTNKRSVALDVGSARGRELFLNLVADADVVFECARPGRLAELGMGFGALRDRQPRIALVSVTPFGQTGPYAAYTGDDIVCFAMGGMSVQGVLGRPPLKLAGYHVQYHAGAVAATAAVAAVLEIEAGGDAAHVDVSVVEAQNGAIDSRRPGLVSYQYTGTSWGRRAEVPVSTIPSAIFPVADGYVQIMTIPAHIPRMLAAINEPALTEFMTNPEGVPADSSTKDMIDAFLLPWLLTRTRQEAMRDAEAHGWAVMPYNHPGDLVDDPHVVDRTFLVDIDDAELGAVTHLGAPFRLDAGWRLDQIAPRLGQHTAEVVRALGVSDRDLADLVADGVVSLACEEVG